MTVIQPYSPEDHESLHARGEGHEDRWWKVVYEPKEEKFDSVTVGASVSTPLTMSLLKSRGMTIG